MTVNKKTGPQSDDNCEETNSTNNLDKLRRNGVPADSLISAVS